MQKTTQNLAPDPNDSKHAAKILSSQNSSGASNSTQGTSSHRWKNQTAKEESQPSNNSGGSGGNKSDKYSAKQVIVREDYQGENALPTGTSFIGKLLDSIDTRDVGAPIKVILPYGGGTKGKILIPKDSIVFGTFNYAGNGDRVHIQFNSGVTAQGKEFKIQAQALNSKNFAPGLFGDYHGTGANRIASTMGLGFVSSLTEIMQQREAIGNSNFVTPKPTMRNAMLGGASKVADMESKRQSEELLDEKPYVTIEGGSDVVISLTNTFFAEAK